MYLFFANILWGHHVFYRGSWGIVHIWATFIMFDYELNFVFTLTITRQRIIPPVFIIIFWPMCFSFFSDLLFSYSKNVHFLHFLWHSWKTKVHCKFLPHENYRDWKLRGPCRENLHYLWKRAVRIVGFPCNFFSFRDPAISSPCSFCGQNICGMLQGNTQQIRRYIYYILKKIGDLQLFLAPFIYLAFCLWNESLSSLTKD